MKWDLIGILNILDRTLQVLVSLPLDPITKEISDQYSYGSKKFRTLQDAITRLRFLLNKLNSPKRILHVDIEKCFNNISHDFV
jgi:RNA-directed DNA polymerase